MLSSELLPSLPCFTLSMPSPRRSPTSLGGASPLISLSRPLSHLVTTMMRSGSRIGSFSAFSILPRALLSVHYSTISRGIFHSKPCSFFGCNFPHSASVTLYYPILLDSSLSYILGCTNGLLQCVEARPRKMSSHRPCPQFLQRHGHCRRPARSRGHGNDRISFRLFPYVAEPPHFVE